MRQVVKTAHPAVDGLIPLNYLLHLPKGYDANSGTKWPFILFLHGSGERGTDAQRVAAYGIPKIAEQRDDFPFIVVSPQCPPDMWWTSFFTELRSLVDEIVQNYAVDETRLYLTGLSMGGFGTWEMAALYPHLFAAMVPICAGASNETLSNMCLLKDLPTWAFHGAQDDVVPLSESEKAVAALKACGGDVKLTVYPFAGHNSWTQTYDNPELYTWFLSHTRQSKSV